MPVDRDGSTWRGGEINAEGQKVVKSIEESEYEHASNLGQAWMWCSAPATFAAADTVLAVRNDSKTLPLHITAIKIHNGDTASRFDVHIITSDYTSAGTTVTPTNPNTDSNASATADATSHADETGNTQGSVIEYPYLAVDSEEIIDARGVDLAQNSAIAVDMVAGGTEVSVTIYGHYGLVD